MLTANQRVPSYAFALLAAIFLAAIHMISATPAAVAQTSTAGQLIISEFRLRGPSGANDEFIEVKTGFLGLGKHYYIPMGAVQEVLTDSIFLSKSRESFAELGFEEKPAHFAELH